MVSSPLPLPASPRGIRSLRRAREGNPNPAASGDCRPSPTGGVVNGLLAWVSDGGASLVAAAARGRPPGRMARADDGLRHPAAAHRRAHGARDGARCPAAHEAPRPSSRRRLRRSGHLRAARSRARGSRRRPVRGGAGAGRRAGHGNGRPAGAFRAPDGPVRVRRGLRHEWPDWRGPRPPLLEPARVHLQRRAGASSARHRGGCRSPRRSARLGRSGHAPRRPPHARLAAGLRRGPFPDVRGPLRDAGTAARARASGRDPAPSVPP